MAIDLSKIEFDTSNPEPRCPCVLLLDTSGSMSGAPIEELNQGLVAFQQALRQDPLAQLRVEVAIITFGPAQVVQDFITANQFQPPQLTASSDTPMATAIHLALDQLNERKQSYKQGGISYYRPWIFLITDGSPTDQELWAGAVQRLQEEEQQKRVAFFSVGVEGADIEQLRQLSTSRPPLMLKGLHFREMFQWLSTSLTSVSHSQLKEEVPLQSPLGWGSV